MNWKRGPCESHARKTQKVAQTPKHREQETPVPRIDYRVLNKRPERRTVVHMTPFPSNPFFVRVSPISLLPSVQSFHIFLSLLVSLCQIQSPFLGIKSTTQETGSLFLLEASKPFDSSSRNCNPRPDVHVTKLSGHQLNSCVTSQVLLQETGLISRSEACDYRLVTPDQLRAAFSTTGSTGNPGSRPGTSASLTRGLFHRRERRSCRRQ